MKIRKNIIITAIIFVLSATAFAQSEAAQTQFSFYGTYFLSPNQTMRLVLQNPRISDSAVVRIQTRVVLDFYEAAGDGSVRTRPVRRVTREIELNENEAASFDIAATLACDGSVCPAARSGVYVSVSLFARPTGEISQIRQPGIISTFVIREAGRTILNLPAVEKGFDPQPDPPVLTVN